MAYVITSACVDVKHKSCAAECPVDCIYEGERSMYINPEECVDCGACRLLCEVDAIFPDYELPESELNFRADNAAFFTEVLPGRDAPIGTPGRIRPRADRGRHADGRCTARQVGS